MSADRPKVPRRIGPGWGRWLGWFVARVLWNTRVVGAERVPRTGPVIVAGNHPGFADGPLMIGTCPRGTHIMVKIELFNGPLGWLFRSTGQIPVDRNSGRPALATALAVLKRGGVVGIFPEGNRGRGDVSDARAGTAWLAVGSGAAVVPVAFLGTRRAGESVHHVPGLRRRMLVEFGEPVVLEGLAGLPRKEAVSRAQDLLREALSDHVQAVSERTGIPLPADGPGSLGGQRAAGGPPPGEPGEPDEPGASGLEAPVRP